MKYLKLTLLFTLLVAIFISCEKDDFLNTGIQGRWQMTKVIKEDKTEVVVDTIFYSFKKGVTQYLKLNSNTSVAFSMGVYTDTKDSLCIDMRKDNELVKKDWDGDTIRTYAIQKHTSSNLELVFNKDTFVFRRY